MIATATQRQSVSFSEYLLRPYDRKRTELVDGTIREMAEASPLHVLIIKLLQRLLDNHLRDTASELETYSGCGVEIPRADRDSNTRTPDLVVCSQAQFEDMLGLTKAIFLQGNPPAIAIEVSSPSNTRTDTEDKRIEYALAGVDEYWIVNPVDGYVMTLLLVDQAYEEIGTFRGGEAIQSKLLPDFRPTADTLLRGKRLER
ncbi:MAG: Uma2 family endonuclease [Cyanobacteria bacterium P01_F01_bin.86]